MFSPLICGSSNNQDQEDDEILEAWTCGDQALTPRKSRKPRSLSFCTRHKDTKNPYADRGLDKFSNLLADIDDKLQKIYTQKGSENISLVRFAPSDSKEFKPIIVKAKGGKRKSTPTSVDQEVKDHNINSNITPVKLPAIMKVKAGLTIEAQTQSHQKTNEDWSWSSYYLMVIMILILFGLALFGRSFAILCTCILWYMVPRIDSKNPKVKRVNKRKEFQRRLTNVKVSNAGISSPISVLNGLNTV